MQTGWIGTEGEHGQHTGVKELKEEKLRLLILWVCYAAGCIILTFIVLLFLQKRDTGAFGTYWGSGNAAIHGLNPYGVYPTTWRSDYRPFGGPSSMPDLNLNPPCVLPLLQALSHLSIERFAVVWTVCSCLIFMSMTAWILSREPQIQNRQVLWLLLSSLPFNTIFCGQIYGLVFLLATLAWFFKKNEQEAGAASSFRSGPP